MPESSRGPFLLEDFVPKDTDVHIKGFILVRLRIFQLLSQTILR